MLINKLDFTLSKNYNTKKNIFGKLKYLFHSIHKLPNIEIYKKYNEMYTGIRRD